MASLPAEAEPARTSRDPERRWWLLAGVGLVVLVGSYVGFVLTASGQALENAALRGADQVTAADLDQADSALHSITVASLALACLVVAVTGLLRRSLPLAMAAVGTIVAGQILTQGLKRVVLPRPALVEASPAYAGNSFPSGHTTIALTVLAAVLILATSRWRGWAMLLIASWTTGIGAYTLTAKWHRLSDTLGAAGVTLIVASAAALWLHRRGIVRPVAGPPRRLRVWFVVLPMAGLVILSGAVAAFVLVATPDLLTRDAVTDYNVYVSLQTLAGAGSMATTLALWWGWHRVEVAPATERDSAGTGVT